MKKLYFVHIAHKNWFSLLQGTLSLTRFERWWCFSGFRRLVDSSVDANFSDKHTISIFNPKNGDSMLLRNTDTSRRVYMTPNPIRTTSLSSPPRKPQISQERKDLTKSFTPILLHTSHTSLTSMLIYSSCFVVMAGNVRSKLSYRAEKIMFYFVKYSTHRKMFQTLKADQNEIYIFVMYVPIFCTLSCFLRNR
jgi:hypothetical protein